VDLRRLKPLDWLTGLFGAALIGLLWAPWYQEVRLGFFFGSSGRSIAAIFKDVNGWQAMAINDVIFLIAGLAGIWVLVATATHSTSAVPIAAAVFATFAGLLASVLAVIRVIFPPDLGPGPTWRAAGVWLGMDAAIGLLLTAAASMRDERRGAGVNVPIREVPAPPVGEGSSA
jgi:hypothetical protein